LVYWKSAFENSIPSQASAFCAARCSMTDEVRSWLEYAEADWKSAAHALIGSPVHTNLVLFLSQQCVEKLLEAALMQRADFPPKTHDLASLSKRLSRLEQSGNGMRRSLND